MAKRRNVNRCDNIGNLIDERKDPFEEQEKRRDREREEVRAGWPPGKELENNVFYFIHFNTLCTTLDDLCLPCEMGVVEFSLKGGVHRVLHRFIDPGKIPSGYRFQCNEKSESTHLIPVQYFSYADRDYHNILQELEQFVCPGGDGVYPPIYSKLKDIEDTELSLAFIHSESQVGRPMNITRVYELETLVVDMYAHMGQNMARSMVQDMLSSSIYDYNSQVQCEWHADKDSKYCSLGITRCISYVISDNLCQLYDFPLTPNHIPDNSHMDDNITIHRPPSSKSSSRPSSATSSNQSGRPPSRSFTETTSSHPSRSSNQASGRTSAASSSANRQSESKSAESSTRKSQPSEKASAQSVSMNPLSAKSAASKSTNESPDRTSVATPSNSQSSDSESTETETDKSSTASAKPSTDPVPSSDFRFSNGFRVSLPTNRGVGRGTPISRFIDPSQRYPIAPPGLNLKSVLPKPTPPGLIVQRGRGFAPDKY